MPKLGSQEETCAGILSRTVNDDNTQRGFCASDSNGRWKFKKRAGSGVAYEINIYWQLMLWMQLNHFQGPWKWFFNCCLREKIQNYAENMSSVFRSRLNKTVFESPVTQKISVHDALLCLNDGLSKINNSPHNCSRPKSVFKPRPGHHVSGLRTRRFGFESGSGQWKIALIIRFWSRHTSYKIDYFLF
jgi:hypothetical protein